MGRSFTEIATIPWQGEIPRETWCARRDSNSRLRTLECSKIKLLARPRLYLSVLPSRAKAKALCPAR